MNTQFEITQGQVTFTANSLTEVKTIIKDNNLDIDKISVNKVTKKDVLSIVKNLIKDNFTMKETREKNRVDSKLTQFESQFMKNDWELPYTFDLLFDIKSEGHIAYILHSDGFLEDNLMETCLLEGLDIEYIKDLVLNKV